jgi:FkbM family methyltransferase
VPMVGLERTRLAAVRDDLIFDLGMHRGEDTAYYLTKGFRVVAVEANPELCAKAAERFADAVRDGRLTIENVAIARDREAVFYESSNDQWGTTAPQWVERNRHLGTPSLGSRTVPGVSVAKLMETHGCPHYLKIDLEGADRLALAALITTPYRPTFISLESEKTSWSLLSWEIDTLTLMGYDRFKAIPQHTVSDQRPGASSCEGTAIPYEFPWSGSSGAFGADLPGPWLPARRLLRQYRGIYVRYALFGDAPLTGRGVRKRIAKALTRVFGEAGWWDTHAAFWADTTGPTAGDRDTRSPLRKGGTRGLSA